MSMLACSCVHKAITAITISPNPQRQQSSPLFQATKHRDLRLLSPPSQADVDRHAHTTTHLTELLIKNWTDINKPKLPIQKNANCKLHQIHI